MRKKALLQGTLVRLLGEPSVQQGKTLQLLGPEKALWLLALLAARADWTSREDIARLLWPDVDLSKARHSLRQLLQRLASLKWRVQLQTTPHHLRWPAGSDLHQFRHCLAVQDWAGALDWHKGDLLQGFEPTPLEDYANWLDQERQQLHAQWMHAATQRVRELEQQGLWTEALHLLEVQLQRDPLAEQALQQHLRLSGLLGQPAPSLTLYLQFARKLKQELDLEPREDTRLLCAALGEGQDRVLS